MLYPLMKNSTLTLNLCIFIPVRPRLYPHEPKATEVGKDSVKLSWQPAEIPYFARQRLPVRYSIDMRTLPGAEWIPVVRSVADTTYTVKGLRPENDYQFRVKAHTDLGSSEPSLPVTVYRKPGMMSICPSVCSSSFSPYPLVC